MPGTLGLEMLELTEGALKSRMPVKRLHFAPNEFLHAASVVALADTTCGYATIAHLPPGAESFTTIELRAITLARSRKAAFLVKLRRSIWDVTPKSGMPLFPMKRQEGRLRSSSVPK